MDYQLVISGTIGSWWGSCSADYVRYVLNQNKDKDVHVGFCSLGGYVKDGLEMNQAFKDHGKVHAHAFGMNASISTIAMLGCKTIDIVKGSFFLIHNVSVWIDKYEQANKEAIDDMIANLKIQRDSLKTFDEVLASMYADKTGKTVDECLAQMKKGNWLTAQQAVDFGLVDNIREDDAAEKAANEFNNNFINSYNHSNYKDAGIPPLPSSISETHRQDIVDGNGNPTQSFLQKTWQGLQNLIHNNQAQKILNNTMDRIFTKIQDLLNVQTLTTDDKGNVVLTAKQAETVENALKDHADKISDFESKIKDKNKELNELKNKVQQLEIDVKEKDEKIKTLEDSDGDITDDKSKIEGKNFSSKDLFDLVSNN